MVVEWLVEKYGECVCVLGLDNNNGMVEVYVNMDSGSWIIMVILVKGLICLMVSG